jgi:predicted nuclease of predicted toxin-antitoxin system
MAEPIRLHLDQQCPNAVARSLRQMSIDVTTTSEARLHDASDLDQLGFARHQRRVLFTIDSDFIVMSQQDANRHHAGIVYAEHWAGLSVGEIVRGLSPIAGVLEPEAWPIGSNT